MTEVQVAFSFVAGMQPRRLPRQAHLQLPRESPEQTEFDGNGFERMYEDDGDEITFRRRPVDEDCRAVRAMQDEAFDRRIRKVDADLKRRADPLGNLYRNGVLV